jgi:hypothetical protein
MGGYKDGLVVGVDELVSGVIRWSGFNGFELSLNLRVTPKMNLLWNIICILLKYLNFKNK